MDKDRNLQRILSNKVTPDPSDDLDDLIMTKVYKTISKNYANRTYLYLAWICFVFGLVSGIIITTIWVKDESFLFGLSFSENKLIIQVICSFVILLLFERIYRITIGTYSKHRIH